MSLTTTAVAQGTNATCLPQYAWMDNSRGQSPCLMAAYLNSACLADPTDAYVYSLPEDYHYRPPTEEVATPCQCSTIFYSMIAACATCQNRSNLPWSSWQTNCSVDYVSVWPANIPPGTSIPAWAYLDVRPSDAFNVSAAETNAAQHPPESSALPSATPSVGFSSTSGMAFPAPSTPVGAPDSSPGKKSDTGAIVGGVVGGIGGAAIVAGTIAFFVLKGRKRGQTNGYTTAPANEQPAPRGDMGAAYIEKPAYDPRAFVAPTPIHSPQPQPALAVYNPNDPSTFPSTSGSPAPISANGSTLYNPSLNHGYVPSHPSGGYGAPSMSEGGSNGLPKYPGGYTGVAEV